MNILITGANGFLGNEVVENLLRRGHAVTALIRPAAREPSWASRVKLFRIDLRAPKGIDEALQGIDTVIHVAAATSGSEDMQFAGTVGGTEHLLTAMTKARTPRLVLISSFVVYDWSKARKTLDENSPIDQNIYDMGAYAIAKSWQERIVHKFAADTGCKTVILRPGFIWGRDHGLIAGMGRKIGKLFLVYGPPNTLPLTHVANCADCVVRAAETDVASGEAFNIVDGFKVSAWQYTGDYLKRGGVKAIRIPFPYWCGFLLASVTTALSKWKFGKRGQLPSFLSKRRYQAQFKPLEFSNQKITTSLQWSPPLNYQQCLNDTYGP